MFQIIKCFGYFTLHYMSTNTLKCIWIIINLEKARTSYVATLIFLINENCLSFLVFFSISLFYVLFYTTSSPIYLFLSMSFPPAQQPIGIPNNSPRPKHGTQQFQYAAAAAAAVLGCLAADLQKKASEPCIAVVFALLHSLARTASLLPQRRSGAASCKHTQARALGLREGRRRHGDALLGEVQRQRQVHSHPQVTDA
jgi:hypothetical protein